LPFGRLRRNLRQIASSSLKARMELFPSTVTWALPLVALLLLSLWVLRVRQRGLQRKSQVIEHLDTVADWPPEAARVMTIDERHAYELLRRAMPGFMVLAQVPLSRFLRVPLRRSYTEWMQRVGSLSADLVLCDAGSRVLAVIDIRPQDETSRSQRRHERMARVLRAAGVHVSVWREGALPTAMALRTEFAAVLRRNSAKPVASRPMPLIPVAEMEEVLAEGDRLAADQAHEPVPSAFFDDMEAEPVATARR
jgi:hypothetical protein